MRIITNKLIVKKIEASWLGCPSQGDIYTVDPSTDQKLHLYFRFRGYQLRVDLCDKTLEMIEHEERIETGLHKQGRFNEKIHPLFRERDTVLYMNYYFDRSNIDLNFLIDQTRNVLDWGEMSNQSEKETRAIFTKDFQKELTNVLNEVA